MATLAFALSRSQPAVPRPPMTRERLRARLQELHERGSELKDTTRVALHLLHFDSTDLILRPKKLSPLQRIGDRVLLSFVAIAATSILLVPEGWLPPFSIVPIAAASLPLIGTITLTISLVQLSINTILTYRTKKELREMEAPQTPANQ